MLLKSICIKNIRSYLDEKINFPEGSVLLSGDVGAGKSSILLSLEFVLFGIQRNLNSSELLRHGKNYGSVELEFSIDGKNYKIKRSLKRGTKGISQDVCELTINDQIQEYTPTELKSKVLEILGYPQELLKKNIPIFRFTVYTAQEQMKQIMLNRDERMNALRKIFDMDKYGRIRNNAKIFSSELRAMKRELDASSKDLENSVKEKEDSTNKKIKVVDEISRNDKLIFDVDLKIEKLNNELSDFRKRLQVLNKLKQIFIEKESLLRNENYKSERTKKEIENLREKIVLSSEELKKFSQLKKPERSFEEINKIIESLNLEKTRIIAEQISTEEQIKNFQSVYEKRICNLCGQKVSDPDSYKNKINIKSERVENLRKSAAEKNFELEKLYREKDYFVKYEYEIKNKQKIEQEIKNFESEKQSLEKDLEDLEIHISKIKSELGKPQNTTQVEKECETLEIEIRKISNDKIYYEKNKSRLEQELDDIERNLITLDKNIEEKKKARAKIIKINEICSWIDGDFSSLMNSIEKHVLLTIKREFDSLFQQWFGIIMQEENISVKIDENFSPIIIQNGFETNYENLSGGEKTSVALAYRLALNKVINSLIDSIKTKDLIILDEPTDGLSADQLDRIRDVLYELKLKQIILVSHEPKIDTYVDNVVRFYKEHHVSKVESNFDFS